MVKNTRTQLLAIQNDFDEAGFFAVSFPHVVRYMSLIRSRNLNFLPNTPKSYSKDYVLIMSPIVDLLNHSFKPNCRIEGEFNQLEGESFVVVRAIDDIEKDQELTINYGDYPNNDFLMKFGFLCKKNFFNELKIELNYDEYLEYTEQQFDLKRKILRTIENITLEEIGLFSNRVSEDIIKMLRIYFLTNDDIMNNTEISTYLWKDFKKVISKENEKKICEFMIKTLKKLSENYQISKKKTVKFEEIGFKNADEMTLDIIEERIKDKNLRNMLQFCLEEEEIINNNLNFFEKRLNSL